MFVVIERYMVCIGYFNYRQCCNYKILKTRLQLHVGNGVTNNNIDMNFFILELKEAYRIRLVHKSASVNVNIVKCLS